MTVGKEIGKELAGRLDELHVEGFGLDLNRPFQFVLVHGAMDRASSMRRLARELKGNEVLLYDRRGYAGSLIKTPVTTPLQVSAEEQVADIVSLCERKPSIVFGHSMGGTYSLIYAALGHANLKGLVLYETPLPSEPWWPSWFAEASESNLDFEPSYFHRRAEAFMISMIGEQNWHRLPPSTKQARRQEGYPMIAEMTQLQTNQGAVPYDSIAVPVLAAVGQFAADRHKAAQHYLAHNLPSDVILASVRGATHGAHISAAPALAELCLELARVTQN